MCGYLLNVRKRLKAERGVFPALLFLSRVQKSLGGGCSPPPRGVKLKGFAFPAALFLETILRGDGEMGNLHCGDKKTILFKKRGAYGGGCSSFGGRGNGIQKGGGHKVLGAFRSR